jgi:hypothetical protein
VTHFLRVIRQARWLQHPDLEWLPPGELQGDALRDLETTDNTLSVYEIKSEAEVAPVTLALAANRDNVAVLDYAIFDDAEFASLGIVAEQREGATPDAAVNAQHYNLRNLTVGQFAGLAYVISRGNHERLPRRQIKTLLTEAVTAGILNRHRMKPQLLRELQQG